MEPDDNDALQQRRRRIAEKKGGIYPAVAVIGGILFLFAAAVILVPEKVGRLLGLGSSTSEEIQQVSKPDTSGISTQVRPEPKLEVETPKIVIVPAPAPEDKSAEYLKRIAELQKQIEDLANKPPTETGLSGEDMKKLLDAQEARLRADAEKEAQRRNQEFQSKLEALEAMIAANAKPAAPTGPTAEELAEAERRRLEEERLRLTEAERRRLLEQERERRQAELEARRAKIVAEKAAREAELEARRLSDSNVFDNSKEGETSGTQEGNTGIQQQTKNEAVQRDRRTNDERFLATNASNADVKTVRARDLTDTSRLIVQGTIITAVLETVVDTELPGNMRAMVNSPVYSYDGSEVLMPAGTRLIGTYNSKISIAQKRVLIAWNRAITPEGKSVSLASTGVDRLGRGGVAGNVDTRFIKRFGSATLISAISAIPAFIAASAGSNTSDTQDAATDTANNVSGDLQDATEDVIEEYLKLPPVIRIPQGTLVKILVNQDLDFR